MQRRERSISLCRRVAAAWAAMLHESLASLSRVQCLAASLSEVLRQLQQIVGSRDKLVMTDKDTDIYAVSW